MRVGDIYILPKNGAGTVEVHFEYSGFSMENKPVFYIWSQTNPEVAAIPVGKAMFNKLHKKI